MKVCFLLGGFQGSGGIGRVTSILANSLSSDPAFEIHTMSYLRDDRPLLYDIEPAIHQHVLFSSPRSMAKAMLLHQAIRKVKTIVRRENIDILIACGALYYPLGILACKGTKTKCLCWEHTNPTTSTDHKFQNLCRQYAAKRCDRLIVLTKSAQAYYLKAYPVLQGKIAQIYNPVEEDAARSKVYDEQSHKIISVGRLTYQKNFERLIALASRILPKYPDWIWDVYGDGEEKEKLQRMINEHHIESQLFLKGQVSNLYDLYGQYAFMVMTSRYEGFPMSLIEGAANRLPLISFDIQTGPNEIIIDGVNGFLVPALDKENMIDRIEKLISSSELRIAMSLESEHSSSRFRIENIMLQWNEMFMSFQRQ